MAAAAIPVIEREQHLLGWQLANAPGADQWFRQLGEIGPSLSAPHDRIASNVVALRASRRQVTPQSVAEQMADDPGLKELRPDYLAAIADAAPTVVDIDDGLNQVAVAIQGLFSTTAHFTTTSASTFDSNEPPPRREHVEGLIPHGAVTILSGDGGTGKSLLALQLAAATATGTNWLKRIVNEPGAVLYISAEDDMNELHRRLAAIAHGSGQSLRDYLNLHLASLAGEEALMATMHQANVIEATPLFHVVKAQVARLRPALVVFDTLSDFFAGNENDRSQAKQFINLLRGIAMQSDATVLLLAHPSLSGMNSGSGTSGSTGWNAGARSRLYLERVRSDGVEDDPDLRILRSMKANYGPTGGEIKLRWHHGAFVADALTGDAGLNVAAHAKAERVFLGLLAAYASEGRNVSASTGHGYAPALFAADKRSGGVGKRALKDAMDRLFGQSRIRTEMVGPASRQTKRLVVAE